MKQSITSWTMLTIGVGMLALGTSSVGAQESDARRVAEKMFREIEPMLATRMNALHEHSRLNISTVRKQLADPEPDWFGVAELDLLFGEYSEALDVAGFSTFRLRWNEWLRQLPPPSFPDLKALVISATERVPAVTAEMERDARLRMQRALQNLDVRMAQFVGAEEWRNFLELKNLRNASNSGTSWTASVQEFPVIEKRLRQGAAAWALPEMQTAQNAVLAAIRNTRWLADKQFLQARVAHLQTIVEFLSTDPPFENESNRQTLGEAYWWLKDNGTDFDVVAALEHHFVRPNLYLHWPKTFVEEKFNRVLEEDFPVDGFYNGTPVQGNGHLKGNLLAKLQPGLGRALIDISLNAETVAKTVGFNGGVRVASTGNTKLRGSKRLELLATGFHSKAADVTANTTVNYDSINTPGGRYGSAAMSQVQAGRPVAERDAEASASRYLRTKLDEGVDSIVSPFNSELQSKLMNPLATQGAWPRTHWIRSGDNGVDIALIDGPPTSTGPLTPPPEVAHNDIGHMLIHCSMLAGIAQRLVGAKNIPGKDIREAFSRAGHSQNLFVASDSDSDETSGVERKPNDNWALVFPGSDAVLVSFRDDCIDLHVRLTQFLADENDYPGAEVSVTFRCVLREGDFILQREGDFTVRPLKTSTGKTRLSGPQQVMRGILLRRLNATVPQEIDTLAWFGQNQSRGKVTSFSMAQGWLVLTF